ncbi:hypothetical protein KBD81_01140 [Candidatus Woesebacteria bacterium]|nr:hypothetical protein [Candidatus Woesebacteria bacterium]
MSTQSKIINQVLQYVIYGIVFLFPLFFLPLTRDFLIYSKFYFLVFAMFGILILSFGKFIIGRKFTWIHNPATQSMILILLSYILSIVLMSPNKLQAIYNPQYGLVMITMFVVFYFYTSHVFSKAEVSPALLLAISGALVSVFSLVIMVDPFRGVTLPAYWSFLTNTTFNPVGSSIHFLAYLLFVLIGTGLYLLRLHRSRQHREDDQSKTMKIILSVIMLFSLLAAVFHIFIIAQQVMEQGAQIVLPPFSLSWYAAVEVLKNPMSALFGVGVDNFSTLFSQVRTVGYNLTDLWQVNTFSTSRSAILHVFTETGLLGIVGYGLLISMFLKRMKEVRTETAGMFIAALVIMFVLPPSIVSYFIFFLSMALMAADLHKKSGQEEYIIDLSGLMPIYIGLMAILVLILGGTMYFLGRDFMAEYYFKKSLDGIASNSLQQLYENQVTALQYNNANEEFHRQFAQTNLIVANNIAAKEQDALTDQDRETIAQAIQTSIVEGKAAVALNPLKVTNWQTLAGIYRQIVNVAENAPVWAVSAYQQAIVLDPRNPTLRLELGGIYYLFQNYDEAQNMFEQAVSLKQDWANAHYNLAWTYYQKELYGPAVDQMQLVVGLIDPVKQQEDYKAAQKTLDDFKVKYQEMLEQQAAAQEGQSGEETVTAPKAVAPAELNLPTPPAANLEEKIELPAEASPEANVTE